VSFLIEMGGTPGTTTDDSSFFAAVVNSASNLSAAAFDSSEERRRGKSVCSSGRVAPRLSNGKTHENVIRDGKDALGSKFRGSIVFLQNVLCLHSTKNLFLKKGPVQVSFLFSFSMSEAFTL
jgi:hypothetical protein